MASYVPRITDAEIEDAVKTAGAVEVRGARAVGKTESARRVAASVIELDTSDPRAVLAQVQPATALDGPTPRLLDEWSVVPGLWNEVRREVDRRRTPGQFLLTGSAWPDEDTRRHSGAGRIQQVTMRTMTLLETGHSTGAVSLRALIEGKEPGLAESSCTFHDVVERLVVGGWPGWWDSTEHAAAGRIRSYIADIAEHDFTRVAGRRRDPRRMTAFLRALAGVEAQTGTYAAVARRINDEASLAVSEQTIPDLFDFAARMYLIEDQLAWSPTLYSRTPLLQLPKRHLADPSLAAGLLGAGVDRLLAEPETAGFLFEAQVTHDIRVYVQSLGWREVAHFRDAKGRDEIDVIVEADDGRWLGMEVKLGLGGVDAAAENLRRVAAKITKPASALVIVVPVGVAHRRADGVDVVPLTVLGP